MPENYQLGKFADGSVLCVFPVPYHLVLVVNSSDRFGCYRPKEEFSESLIATPWLHIRPEALFMPTCGGLAIAHPADPRCLLAMGSCF